LTDAPGDDPKPPRQPVRRFFSDEEKRAIALESDQPGVSVSQVARKHGIVTGMLFRWRVQFGVAQKKRAQLAPAVLTDGTPAVLLLRDLVQPQGGMMAVDLPDGRRVFAPAGSDPDAVREYVEREEKAP
jgi:transposase-like protein